MNTHNPANDHWPKARPLRHRSVAMRSRWNVPRSYLVIFMVNFPLATIMLYHVTSLFLIVYPSICPISSFDSDFHILLVHSKISPCFPVFPHESTPFLTVKLNPVFMVKSRSFPHKSWMEPPWNHHGSCGPWQFFDGTKLLIETQLACDVLLIKHGEVLRRFFTEYTSMKINEFLGITFGFWVLQSMERLIKFHGSKPPTRHHFFLVLPSGKLT